MAGSFSYVAEEDRWIWSDEVARMFGYATGTAVPTSESIVGHTHPDDRPAVARLVEQVRRAGVPFSSRHRIVDTAGQVRLVVVVGDSLHAHDGTVIGTSGFYVDVSDEFDSDVRRSLDEVIAVIAARRATINQAMGMLMLAHGITAERAFEILAWRSQESNVKLRDIAERFVAEVTAAGLLPKAGAATMDHILLTAHERINGGA
ncbi:ANTAR domain-containing protein [Mycobacterium sp. PS03-16]|nr:ANTAR domain-containing protein [Mycobacterium sp. PS03-16]